MNSVRTKVVENWLYVYMLHCLADKQQFLNRKYNKNECEVTFTHLFLITDKETAKMEQWKRQVTVFHSVHYLTAIEVLLWCISQMSPDIMTSL